MKRAYKVELDPNNKQRGYFGRCAGTARYVYNWGLAEWKRQYEEGDKPSAYGLRVRFNAQKDDLCPWIRELPYPVTEAAFENLGKAFQNFFRQVKNGDAKAGYPKFKKRGQYSSFQLRGYKTANNSIWLGRAIGWVRLKEQGYLPLDVAYRQNGGSTYITISERAGRWYASVQVEEPDRDPIAEHGTIGVDVGIKSLAVCSDGTTFENPKAFIKYQCKLNRLQRELSRRTKGGANWRKTKAKIARTHQKIANIRKHALHQVSHYVIEEARPAVVIIEDLNVKGMMKNHRLAQAVSDASMYELHRQIRYKAEWAGIGIVKADRWYASSKMCSQCGCVRQSLMLGERVFKCPECGLELDRDLNAARNLAALGEPSNGRELPTELKCGNASL
jgi:putative transposase